MVRTPGMLVRTFTSDPRAIITAGARSSRAIQVAARASG
jgi:hypothetical protein